MLLYYERHCEISAKLPSALKICVTAINPIFQVAGVLVILVYLFIFWLHCIACSILVPQAAIKLCPLAVEVQSHNHWTAREFPGILYVFIPQMPPQSAVRCFAYIQHDELSLDPVAFHTCLSCLTMCLNLFVFISVFLLK